ncbi:MAG TPA: GNAT family N-acetyltransferase [Actinocrinis sp.]|jgi:GNAT superfamily N-acetyltransferase
METTEAAVRRAKPDDLNGLLECVTGLFAEDGAARDALRNPDWPARHGEQWCRELLAGTDALVLVADAGGEIVGHLVGTFAKPSAMWLAARAELVSMYVTPSWRGGGLGGRLVEGFTGWARERGAERLVVEAYTANEGAVRFYRRNGFAPRSATLTAGL